MVELPKVQFCELSSGRKLAWREWGEGPPLIMLHGWSMSSVVFAEVAGSLAIDFRVLCPDLPGHGYSEPLADCCLSGMAESIEQWVTLLKVNGADLLGWSLGGQVALQIAAGGRLPVSKLLLVATSPRFCQSEDWLYGLPQVQVTALQRNLRRAYEKTMGDFFNLQFVDDELTKDRYRQILTFAVRSGQLPDLEVACETLQILSVADLRSELRDIKSPTLITHGELDQIIPFSAGEYLATLLPHAQLYRLPAIGHAPFFSNPEACVSRWREFLQ